MALCQGQGKTRVDRKEMEGTVGEISPENDLMLSRVCFQSGLAARECGLVFLLKMVNA